MTRGCPKKRFTIQLDMDTLAELRELARSLDVRPNRLALLRVHERLHQERLREKAGQKE